MEIAKRNQEQIDLPEHGGMPRRVVTAIEKPMPLTFGCIEFGMGSDADQLPGEVARLLLKRILCAALGIYRSAAAHVGHG